MPATSLNPVEKVSAMKVRATKLTLLAGMLLLGLVATLLAGGSHPIGAEEWTRNRVRQMDLTASEKGLEKVGWVPTLDEALALSHRTGRAIVVFCQGGDLAGRC